LKIHDREPSRGYACAVLGDRACRARRDRRTRIPAALTLKRQPSWPLVSLLPTAASSATAGQVPSRPSSRVRRPCRFTDAVALRSQTALTGSACRGQSKSGSKPACTVERDLHGGPVGVMFSRQPTGVGAAVAGAAGGSGGVRAVSAARAARRAGLIEALTGASLPREYLGSPSTAPARPVPRYWLPWTSTRASRCASCGTARSPSRWRSTPRLRPTPPVMRSASSATG
jgi:hypothetical protein